MTARIKVGALPTDVVTGKVSRIAPAGAAEGRRDALRRRDRARPGLRTIVLRAGYSANADLIIREKKDVVTIPERARHLRGRRQEGVRRAAGATPKDEPKKVEIKLGISDGLNVEVPRGSEEGRQGRRAAAEESAEALRPDATEPEDDEMHDPLRDALPPAAGATCAARSSARS